jgi:hypothetical protein
MANKRTGTDPHLYGTPDADNPPAPAPNGMRGEKRSLGAGFKRVDRIGGRDVVVEEESGTAFVEASGRAGSDSRKE